MDWMTRHGRGSDVAQVLLEEGGVVIGDLIAVQMPGDSRRWSFKVRTGGTEILRWDYLPPGELRRHRNPSSRPAGYDSRDTSVIHEHAPVVDLYDNLSVPLPERDTTDHNQAFRWFCKRANIAPGDAYRPPPEPQLALMP
jgi:hypothetical protein